ncbi:MAG: hypothetical protein V1772_05635 [Chloroflexota bacterium]
MTPSPSQRDEPGLGARAPGASWWAAQWLRSVAQWMPTARLLQGRDLARQGRVQALTIAPGLVEARVCGEEHQACAVRVEVTTYSEDEWERVIGLLADQAIYAAQLLNGEMPRHVEEACHVAGVDLYPTSSDVHTTCSCGLPDEACEHAAAVYQTVGEQLGRDPFILFVLRGRAREQIMSALRVARAARLATDPAGARAARPAHMLDISPDAFWRMSPAAQRVQIRIAPPELEMELLRMLGDPTFVPNRALIAQLERVYRAVSDKAIAFAYRERQRTNGE